MYFTATFRSFGLWLRKLSAWFVVYVAVGGALGFAVRQPYTEEASCFPFSSVFGVIVSNCPDAWVNWFWDATVGWPRFVIVLPAIAIAALKVGLEALPTHWSHRWVDAAAFATVSTPIVLLLWTGIRYWHRRHPRFAALLGVAVLSETIILGLTG